MKSFVDRLSPDEMAAVAKFVKTLANDSTRAP
jgi:cytochrome c553